MKKFLAAILAALFIVSAAGCVQQVKKYTVTFVNEDGTELQKSDVTEGEIPSYTGKTPVKEEDDKYTYTFSGWTPEVAAVSANQTYTAVYDKTAKIPPEVGEWRYEIDFGTLMGKSSDESPMQVFTQFGLEDTLKELKMKMNLSLTEDGKVRMSIDKEAMLDAMNTLVEKMMEALPEILAKQMGISVEELEKTLASQGMSLDTLVGQIKSQINMDSLSDSFEQMNFTGTYRLDGNKLYMTRDGQEENTERYTVIEVSETELKFMEIHNPAGEESSEENARYEELLPMVFKRQ